MNTRDTSIDSYRYAVETGLVSKCEAEVLRVIAEATEPMNQTMVWKRIGSDVESRTIGPRFVVLVRKGLIQVVGKKACPFTQRRTLFYSATGEKPMKAPRTKREKQETFDCLKKRVSELTEDVRQLRALLEARSPSHAIAMERAERAPVETQIDLFEEV